MPSPAAIYCTIGTPTAPSQQSQQTHAGVPTPGASMLPAGLWRYNPKCKVTPVVLYGVVSLLSSHMGSYPQIASTKGKARPPAKGVPCLPGEGRFKKHSVWDKGHPRHRVTSQACLVPTPCPYWGGTHDKKMSKGHLHRVVYHHVYNVY